MSEGDTVAQYSLRIKVRSGNIASRYINSHNYRTTGAAMKKWNRVSYAMINAIINNNESIPSIMCEDIERTISMRDWQPFSRLTRQDTRKGNFSKFVMDDYSSNLTYNADLH